jgi:protein arginine kinase activator
MKLCQSCQQRPAVVEFIQVTGTVRRELSLCRECAMTHGMAAQIAAFQQLSKQIIEHMKPIDELPLSGPETQIAPCTSCGLSFDEFIRTGLLGCPQCYQSFGDVLSHILRRLHGVSHMTGSNGQEGHKHPAKTEHSKGDAKPGGQTAREELEIKIELALLEENYELAAQLRDQLKNL